VPTRWLVDGTNVVGARPDGWWRDRPAAFRRLVDELAPLVAAGDDVTVVFDGRPTDDLPDGAHVAGVRVHWATRRGRDAADDRLVELVAADPDPGALAVITSDRGLAGRVAGHGVEVVGAGAFRRRLDDAGP
jgi:predicted RNA-binding protein with PIN domain